MGSLEKRLREAFPNLTDNDFGYHATDLYVVAYPEVRAWLKDNYEYYCNITSFIGEGEPDWNGHKRLCLDIPFAGNWPERAFRAVS